MQLLTYSVEYEFVYSEQWRILWEFTDKKSTESGRFSVAEETSQASHSGFKLEYLIYRL